MIGKFKNKIKKENGAVTIVEASFVFPIMFIVLFFLIYMGNAFYVKAQVEALVQSYAIEGAARCADPMLENVDKTGKFPSLDKLKIQPYRYIFGGMDDVETDIAGKVKKEISKSTSFFKNMSPVLKNKSSSNIAKYQSYVVYSTFSVDVDYSITFPIRFLGTEKSTILNLEARSEVAVNDTTEFIRNTDMVIDMISGTKLGENISDIFNKINSFLGQLGGKES